MFIQTDHSSDRSERNDELWQAYLEGQKQALGRIFLQHYSRLYLYGMKLTGNEAAVKDSIQELFLKLWEKREEIAQANSVEFYLLHSMRRILLRHKEQTTSFHRRNKEYMEEVSNILQSEEDRIIFEERVNKRYQLFLKAQKNLTPRQKEILYLRLHHGMTNTEIADFLGLSKQRVKNCMYESIKLLRECISHSIIER